MVCSASQPLHSHLGYEDLNAHEEVLMTSQKNLIALKEMLDTNPLLFHSAPGELTGARGAAVSEQEAWKVRMR